MDKKSLLAIALITVIILLLPSYYELTYDQPTVTEPSSQPVPERQVETQSPGKTEEIQQPATGEISEVSVEQSMDSQVISPSIIQTTEMIVSEIETPLVSAKISNQGGGTFEFWYLKEYDTWIGEQAKIIDPSFQNGIEQTFITSNGERINLRDYRFEIEGITPGRIELGENDTYTIYYKLSIDNFIIRKEITLYGNSYHMDINIKVANAENLLLNDDYEISWINGIPPNEKNMSEEYTYSESYAKMGGELESFNIDSEEEIKPLPMNGNTEWIATRTKYFLSAIIPLQKTTSGAVFGGKGVQNGEILEPRYSTSLICDVEGESINDTYRIFMGPLDHSVLSDYDNDLDELLMNHGWYESTFRPVSLFLLKIFKFFHLFIPNYGIVIILFSVLVKIVVYPLTKKSYQSMKEMSKVQPLLAELKEKYKSDPQRMNKETMKLYKEHGINPLGGCLPMLLQLPLLGALFIVFRSTIQLRGASFIPGWIDDLSQADTIFTLPFSLPLYGDQFNILPILMAVTMMFQSKMTMQDPKQKAMVYMMPVFMLLIFNQFPSGLNLYYTMFNLLTIIQQRWTDGTSKSKKNK